MKILGKTFAVVLGFAALAGLLAAAEPTESTGAPPPRLGSAVYRWEDLAVKPTPVGERRDVANNPTPTFETFECHLSTLNPGKASHLPHTHAQEEVILVREGTLEVMINGGVQRASPGSILFFASNQPHSVRNVGTSPANYAVLNFATAETRRRRERSDATLAPGQLVATVFDWDQLTAKPTKVGERRDVTDGPTATLKNFECHVTTLLAGESPHPAHHHPDEEFIVIKEGTLDVTINGHTQRAGRGSVVFYASGDEHGMKNIGDKPATYYVIRAVTDLTPKVAKGG